MRETKSKWNPVLNLMKDKPTVELGKYASYWFHKTPRRMLHSLSYYKFAAKLIGDQKKILDIGCNEGLGTYLLAKECSYAKGVDFDTKAIEIAQKNFSEHNICFEVKDFLCNPEKDQYDAVVNFDVIEHIYPENIDMFFTNIKSCLNNAGMSIIGTPSKISQQYASNISKKGHVNIYSPNRLLNEMRKHFEFVFLFSANDELVHTGFYELAHYLIVIGTKRL
jgi:2-polyprenyl-3-methyl-5-hydroxy-6-metoxy-1,4-benzoquinol methylase